jgi:hypothetical protein
MLREGQPIRPLVFRLIPAIVTSIAAFAFGTSLVGQQVTFGGCVDSMGIAVASIRNAGISDVAEARFAPSGAPIIFYNPRVLSWFAPQTRLWWYGHECAHHALGHLRLRAFPPAAERQADCWAASELVRKGLLGREDIQVVAADLAKLQRSDWSHLPGPFRAVDVLGCGGFDPGEGDEDKPTECLVRFRSWKAKSGGSASFDLEIEGEDVALLDNDMGDDEATIDCPKPGTLEYRLHDVEIHAPNGMTVGSGGTCEGSFRANKNKTTYTVTLLAGAGQLRCRID